MEKHIIKQPYCEKCVSFKPYEYMVDGKKKVICRNTVKCKCIYEYLKTQLQEK